MNDQNTQDLETNTAKSTDPNSRFDVDVEDLPPEEQAAFNVRFSRPIPYRSAVEVPYEHRNIAKDHGGQWNKKLKRWVFGSPRTANTVRALVAEAEHNPRPRKKKMNAEDQARQAQAPTLENLARITKLSIEANEAHAESLRARHEQLSRQIEEDENEIKELSEKIQALQERKAQNLETTRRISSKRTTIQVKIDQGKEYLQAISS